MIHMHGLYVNWASGEPVHDLEVDALGLLDGRVPVLRILSQVSADARLVFLIGLSEGLA